MRDLSLSSHPWRPKGSPNVVWKALGGVNKNQALTKNKFKKEKVVKHIYGMFRESLVIVSTICKTIGSHALYLSSLGTTVNSNGACGIWKWA
jgi:hypothetical protein